MTPRWAGIAFLIFGLSWLTMGALTLAEGGTGMSVVQLALGIGFLMCAFKGMRPTVPSE